MPSINELENDLNVTTPKMMVRALRSSPGRIKENRKMKRTAVNIGSTTIQTIPNLNVPSFWE